MIELILPTAVLVLLLLAGTWWGRWRRQRLLATVQVMTLPGVASSYRQNRRDIQVFLPPGYGASAARYPVLYLNDGQDVAQLGLRETLATLLARKQLRPLLVVAIPTNEARLEEYGTAVCANAQGLGSQAAAYAQFVRHELMPLINHQFRTETGARETAVLGASLGGLSAFDLAWNHPDQFGTVGVFSGSFWWRSAADCTEFAPGRRIAHELVRRGAYRPHQRFWFQAGTQDEAADRDNNGVIDAIQDTLELIDELIRLGYRYGTQLVYLEVRGGRHNYDTWAEALPHFLTWAFPPTADH